MVITLVTIGLLFAGNFAAMQTMVVLAGLPFSVVLILFMFGLHKAMRQDAQMELEQANQGRVDVVVSSVRALDRPRAATDPSGGSALHGQTRDARAGRSGRAFAQSGLTYKPQAGQSQALHGCAG